jgi:hypothetical protein
MDGTAPTMDAQRRRCVIRGADDQYAYLQVNADGTCSLHTPQGAVTLSRQNAAKLRAALGLITERPIRELGEDA